MMMIRTFFERRLFILFQSLDRDCLQPNACRRILLQHIPHVLFAQHKQIAVSHRPNARRSSISCLPIIITQTYTHIRAINCYLICRRMKWKHCVCSMMIHDNNKNEQIKMWCVKMYLWKIKFYEKLILIVIQIELIMRQRNKKRGV